MLIDATPAMRDGRLPINLIDHVMVSEAAEPLVPEPDSPRYELVKLQGALESARRSRELWRSRTLMIRERHHLVDEVGAAVAQKCFECRRRWPCPTNLMTSGDYET